MTETRFQAQRPAVPAARRIAGATPGRLRIHRDSTLWPAVAAAVFTLAVLLSAHLRMSLRWDEAVYASQISQHVPIMPWAPERARGVPLLIAPITVVSGSALALRCYVTVLAGIALFLALLAWRGTRPGWQLGLSGVIFGGLAVTQTQAWQVFPNYWIATGCLAGAGLAVRAIRDGRAPWPVLAALATAAAFTALMRPADAVVAFVPLLLMAVAALRMRAAPAALATAFGLVIGVGEWLIEADVYFHGPLARLKGASAAVGGTHPNLLTSVRILNGDTINTVRAASVRGYPTLTGWSHPWLLTWWAALLVLVIAGVMAARRAGGWCVALAPVLPALGLYLEYSLPVEHSVRYLLPVCALLAVPAAGGIGWLAAVGRGLAHPVRLAALALAGAFLATELASQQVLAVRESAGLVASAKANIGAAHALRRLGVRPPCIVTTVPRPRLAGAALPAAYYAGCAYVYGKRNAGAFQGNQVVLLVKGRGQPLTYAAHWTVSKIAGHTFAYVSPRPRSERQGVTAGSAPSVPRHPAH